MFDQDALVLQIPPLRRFALRLTRNASDADDLLQSTLLRALEKQELFENGTNLFSWSSKIMFNIFAGEYRRRKKFSTQYDPEHYIEKASSQGTQEDSVDLAIVQDSMKLLSNEHREIINVVCVMDTPYAEAAEMLELPMGTVRSRLSRARHELREILEPSVPAWQTRTHHAMPAYSRPAPAGRGMNA